MKKYYATYKNIGDSDIAVFNTKKERDAWVNFKDEFSIVFDVNEENATFERMVLSNEIAEERIRNNAYSVPCIKDGFNSDQKWYIFSE